MLHRWWILFLKPQGEEIAMVQIYFRSSKKNNVNKNNEIIRNRLVCSREQILSDILIILDSFQIFHVGYPGLRICQCPLEAIY